MKKKYNN